MRHGKTTPSCLLILTKEPWLVSGPNSLMTRLLVLHGKLFLRLMRKSVRRMLKNHLRLCSFLRMNSRRRSSLEERSLGG
ncbi:hypothetical protein CR513_24527 [Mucuna pruriens]|uniref:Uncharacterized protein n=1 Tax=Mucuna pruriens TaxID=157652 RepID=A0A371GRQ9_MUCPR|nr:hypothetical protein CR513_24527 [Mucuna pruriens]